MFKLLLLRNYKIDIFYKILTKSFVVETEFYMLEKNDFPP